MVPAVAGLKKQGANNGACLSFLISTPETGVDSIALTYSLLDPVLTVIRPVTAFVTALFAGVAENLFSRSYTQSLNACPDRTCVVDGCCDGTDCSPEDHARHHTALEKLLAGVRFATDDLMHDLAGWFVLGIFLAALITVLVPETLIGGVFGSGIVAYLGMLVVSLPMYVCASMSTPIAAALVVKGMSPGAALVLLMAGPATNMATITMVGGLLGRRTLGIYLGSIIGCTLLMAFATDMIYHTLGISAQATAGIAGRELIPFWLESGAAVILAILIARVFVMKAQSRFFKSRQVGIQDREPVPTTACGCEHGDTGST